MDCTMLGRTVCNCMVTFLLGSWESWVCLRSRRDPAEGVVVVGGVVTGFGGSGLVTAAYDAASAAVAHSGRGHRVFAVPATRPDREQALAVAEHRSVPVMSERAARL